MEFLKNGSEYISGLIADAVKNGHRTVTVTGNYEIDSSVRLPSDFELVLEDCHLRMADGVYDNMFVNEHHGTSVGRTVAGTDRNIRITGKGVAILDGGNYNGLSEKNHLTNGLPPIWKNNLVLFTNVDGFAVGNIACHDQRWWAINLIYCRNGRLFDIDFKACDISIDRDGNEYHGLIRERYAEVLVKNADGIDLRQGCNNITIEHITGFTEDDTVALTNLNGRLEREYAVAGLSSDICNVTIRDIKTSAYCSIVRLLNQGEERLHDIVIEDVYDTSAESPYMDSGNFALRVGDGGHLYGSRHSTANETYNITVRRIYGRGKAVLHLAGEIGNLVIENAIAANGTPLVDDHRTAL